MTFHGENLSSLAVGNLQHSLNFSEPELFREKILSEAKRVGTEGGSAHKMNRQPVFFLAGSIDHRRGAD
jgi:hypothetical protein